MLKIQILGANRMVVLHIFTFRKVFFSNLVKRKENVEQKKEGIKFIVVNNVTLGNTCDFIIIYELVTLFFIE